jgi:hypothetical protein
MTPIENRRTSEHRPMRRVVGAGQMLAEIMETLGLDTDLAVGRACSMAVNLWDEALVDFAPREAQRPRLYRSEFDGLPIEVLTSMMDLMVLQIDQLREQCGDQAAELAVLRRHCSALTGAGAGLLDALHRAGGWHVADPGHQPRISQAMAAQEAAVVNALRDRGDLDTLSAGVPEMEAVA